MHLWLLVFNENVGREAKRGLNSESGFLSEEAEIQQKGLLGV